MFFILNHIVQVLTLYKGREPLSSFLKVYFKNNSKLGSRDRRAITEAVYTYYRNQIFYENQDMLSIIYTGLKKVENNNEFLEKVFLKNNIKPIPEKDFEISKRFNNIKLSSNIDKKGWLLSHLKQPDLFIRLQNNKQDNETLLKENNIDFEKIKYKGKIEFEVIRIPNTTKINQTFPPKDYIVQDLSSQMAIAKAFDFKAKQTEKGKTEIWDVCAGAGGKSIFWKTFSKNDFILASDNRMSILKNLEKRFSLYNIDGYNVLQLDASLEKNIQKHIQTEFDFIICDVPCSGSGTWNRTPERLTFFKEKELEKYTKLQYQISINALRSLKDKGLFFYITCSVFQKENEDIVTEILKQDNIHLIHKEAINGIANNANSLFLAVLQKRNA